MYTCIAVPVDLAHVDRLHKALSTAADLARHWGVPVHFIGATTETPGPLARTPEAYQARLQAFADEQARTHGIDAHAKAVVSLDLAADLDRDLQRAVDEVGADLVIVASHLPGLRDLLLRSNASWLVRHERVSVFVVR